MSPCYTGIINNSQIWLQNMDPAIVKELLCPINFSKLDLKATCSFKATCSPKFCLYMILKLSMHNEHYFKNSLLPKLEFSSFLTLERRQRKNIKRNWSFILTLQHIPPQVVWRQQYVLQSLEPESKFLQVFILFPPLMSFLSSSINTSWFGQESRSFFLPLNLSLPPTFQLILPHTSRWEHAAHQESKQWREFIVWWLQIFIE